jgi:hypothetical protein
MKLVRGLNISVENPLDALQRRPGFRVSDFSFKVCSVSEKELQCMKMITLLRCKDAYVTTGSILAIYCALVGFVCDLLTCRLVDCHGWKELTGAACVSTTGLAELFVVGCQISLCGVGYVES